MQFSERFGIVGEYNRYTNYVYVFDSEDGSCELVSGRIARDMDLGYLKPNKCSISKLRMLYPFEVCGNILELRLFNNPSTYCISDNVDLYFSVVLARIDQLSRESVYRQITYSQKVFNYPDDWIIFFNIGVLQPVIVDYYNSVLDLEVLNLTETSYYYSKPYLRELRGFIIPPVMFDYIMRLVKDKNAHDIMSAFGFKVVENVCYFHGNMFYMPLNGIIW